ncbi:hypothetical protein PHISP_04236 [Aspergillus sp. HF37]|nr:hypothetical protein PHISP_04236 [Aspergillus sp. HF37]
MSRPRRASGIEGPDNGHMALPDITGRVFDSHARSTSSTKPNRLSASGAACSERDFNILFDAPADFWAKSSIAHRDEQGSLLSSGKTAFRRFSKRDINQFDDDRDEDDGRNWYRSHVRCGDRIIDGRLIELTLETIAELPEPDEMR